jgi:uncharacterized protein YjbI with pentapeptide repeats
MKYEISSVKTTEPIFSGEYKSFMHALEDAVATNVDLSGAVLSHQHLVGANLRNAKLKGAVLSFCKLDAANLCFADLSYAHLCHTNFFGANLFAANLVKAHFTANAFFGGANIVGCQFSNDIENEFVQEEWLKNEIHVKETLNGGIKL